MAIYSVVVSPDGVLRHEVLPALPKATRALRTDPIWSVSRGRAEAVLQRFGEAALEDAPEGRANSVAAVLEAQLAAGLTEQAIATLSAGGGALDHSIAAICRLLAAAGLRDEAFGFARDRATSLQDGVDAAVALMTLWPDDAEAIIASIERTCTELQITSSTS